MKVSELKDRDLALFKEGIETGRSYWDGYYGTVEDIVKMLGDEELSVSDSNKEPLDN